MGVLRIEAKTTSYETTFLRKTIKITVLMAVLIAVPSFFFFYKSASSFNFLTMISQGKEEELKLNKILKNASMGDNTVILTTVNEAWAANNSLLDIFLESFRIGNGTERLLNHLVIITFDEKAYARCLTLHHHCYALRTGNVDFSKEARFLSHDYLEMMWRRIDFLHSILKMGYNFIFTDVDIMWFRDPFQRFYPNADFQIACDKFRGNPLDINNSPNGGFTYVKSNPRTIKFYEFWYSSRLNYPGNHDQDVLNKIKHDPFITKIGLKIRFLDTTYFGGFCEPRKNLYLVCTMHANCCVGLDYKIHDLKILLQDWTKFKSSPNKSSSWTVPQKCRLSSFGKP